MISSDDLLGNLDLNLTKLIRGACSSADCKITMITEPKKNKSFINMYKLKKNDRSYKSHRGWWPFISNKRPKLAVIFLKSKIFAKNLFKIFCFGK